jgi:acetyl-CoA carboxylase biotin carboxyl carrier protein
MTNDEIKELIELVSSTGIGELEVQRGENRVRIRRAFAAETNVIMPPPAVVAVPQGVAPVPVAAAPAPVTPAPAHAEPAVAKSPDSLVFVKSPIVGTFYESASPGTPPFVKIGDHVTAGTVLCIIESMKLMNEIEADVAGVVETRVVQNGQPVEYGEALFGIRPV